MLENAGATAKNSMSLDREPAAPTDAIRGNTSYLPFWPGSFPKPEKKTPELKLDDSDLLNVPPGFSTGLIFDEDGCTVIKENSTESRIQTTASGSKKIVNLLDLVHQEQDLLGKMPL